MKITDVIIISASNPSREPRTQSFAESLIAAIFLHRLSHIVALLLIDLLLYVMSDELIQMKPSGHFC